MLGAYLEGTRIILKGTCFRLGHCTFLQAKKKKRLFFSGRWLEDVSATLEGSEEFKSSKLDLST